MKERERTNQMVELPQTHLSTNILSHRNDRNTDDSQTLMQHALLLSVEMVGAVVKHGLNLENVSGAGVSANVGEDGGLLCDWVGDGLKDLDGRV